VTEYFERKETKIKTKKEPGAENESGIEPKRIKL
jgi:hypothetical protein